MNPSMTSSSGLITDCERRCIRKSMAHAAAMERPARSPTSRAASRTARSAATSAGDFTATRAFTRARVAPFLVTIWIMSVPCLTVRVHVESWQTSIPRLTLRQRMSDDFPSCRFQARKLSHRTRRRRLRCMNHTVSPPSSFGSLARLHGVMPKNGRSVPSIALKARRSLTTSRNSTPSLPPIISPTPSA